MLSIIKSYYSPQKVESAPAPVAVEAWFPTEILLLIIFHLGSFSRRSLRSLLYVSRDAYQLTLPILYRDLVFLKDPSNPGDFRHRLESLDATLSAQSHLATYARSVHIHVQDVGTDPLIEKVLTRLVNLEALAVNINEHSFLLRSLPKFEHLRCFVTRGAWNEEQMVGFLRRQDTLEAIDLGFHCPWGRGSPYPTSNMLPQLRSIVCKGDMWPNLAGRDQLEHLSGSMYNFNRSHDAINRSSSMFSNLRSMSALEIDQRTFERIAPLLSKVEYLDIQLRFYTFEPMEVLSHIPSQSLRYVRFKLDSPYSPQVDFVDEIFRAFPALLKTLSMAQSIITGIGTGDCFLVKDFLPPEIAEHAFESVVKEADWGSMFHRGGEVPRLVAVQGKVEVDGSFPVYRHPTDTAPPLLPFTPTVEKIRQYAQDALKKHVNPPGNEYEINHVLIQHYRSGADYISEHSDKTIDILPGSVIINVSLGSERVMVLREKRAPKATAALVEATPIDPSSRPHNPPRPSQRIPLPHNSLFSLSLPSNRALLHAIPTDKRPLHLKSPEEQFKGGERVSLTFRCIGTFVRKDARGDKHLETGKIDQDDEGKWMIWGSGAVGKTKETARPVIFPSTMETGITGGTEEDALLEAFGRENREGDGVDGFDWQRWYGRGFDVVNFGF
ncbi:hypothetical protein ONZ45_g2431 [Pleurotus djamor]|nr:hypothetical protein ONZ45_g2431 [Pleurotus djamor]